MCGIIGLINHRNNGLWKEDTDLVKRMLYIDKERGEDSTGLFTVLNSGVCMLAKEASTPEQFMYDKEVEEIFKKSINSGSVLVGHNRKATKGEINDENAHPFNRGDIVLVHNGSLYNHKSVANTEVDSEAIADVLNEHENGDLATAFGKLDGAYSCVWYDNRDQSLNFFRNAARPMYLYEDTNRTLFASEAVMIIYSLTRSNIKWDNTKLIELPVHHHLRYKLRTYGGFGKEGDAQEVTPNFPQGSTTTPTKVVTPTTTAAAFNGADIQTTKNSQNTTECKPIGHLSLQRRKSYRKIMQTWLQKTPIKSPLTFYAEDYTQQEDGSWLIWGKVKNTPPFINASMTISSRFSEEDVTALCDVSDMEIDVTFKSYEMDHKKMVFQINTEMVDETVYFDEEAHSPDDAAFATVTLD